MMGTDYCQIPSIEDSVPLDPSFPTVSERYFQHYYYVPKKQVVKAVDPSTAVVPDNETKQIDQKSEHKVEQDALMDDSSINLISSERQMDRDDNLPCKKRQKMEDDCERSASACDGQQGDKDVKCPINNDLVQRMNSGAVISTASLANPGDDALSVDVIQRAEHESDGKDGLEPADKEYHITGKETLVMVHSNKLCIVSLSPYHPIVRENKTVVKVDYEVFGIDRLSNKVSGKGKRGAQVMGSKATLCRMHTSDGTTYDVTCGARGKLVQVNEKLLQKPDMARSQCGAEGWLGVVLPSLQHYDALIAAMMPASRYEEAFKKQFGEQAI